VCAFLEFLQVHNLCLVSGFSILEETFSLQIKSPLKKMVIFKGDHEVEEVGGVVGDLSTVVLSSPLLFEDFLLNLTEKVMTSSTDTQSVLGLWHWLPSRFVGNTAPKGSNGLPSFFLSLGLSTKTHPRSEKQDGPLLQRWLVGQAPLWAQELSSQWQVHQHSLTITLPEDKHKGLSLAFCESAYTSSPPKCVSMSHTTTASSEIGYDIPTEARLQVHHNSTDLAHCRSSHLSEDANGDVNGELWILQDVERTLVGNGAHRTLQSVVTVALQSRRTIESQQPHCYLRILERLPTGVFADQYELQGLRRRGVVKEAFVYGDKNLERPALLSAQSIVDVHVTLLKEQSKQSSQVPLLLQAKVSVPLHARYPPLSVESHSVVRIPLPHIFVACKQAGVQDSSALDETVGDWRPVLLGAITTSTNSSKVVEWMVPAGKPAQFEVVARYTAIAALSGVLAVFVASVSKEHHY
jgi:phosphatidylinositol glycan class X